ncbi:hypothetical protein [Chryseobacterium sp. 8AT]|uniref:hypothetical protein n=1 Tax=Chryseobacterium sp. 8AT TaxID=2653134 RepID=UPI0012EF8CAB|nr:hypothetical protein [Chryseobacterium sp. 8AT]VXB03398.1 conserved hypothetical protein [Chryseobacterium sp. 8AT]
MDNYNAIIEKIIVSDEAVKFSLNWLGESKNNALESHDLSQLVRLLLKEVNHKSNDAKFEIESVDRYFYFDGGNSKRYVETTFWYNPYSLERKETQRNEFITQGQEYKLPEWARSISVRRKDLEPNFY